jgi:glutaredoxin-related protein
MKKTIVTGFEVYSEADASIACIQVLEQINANVALGTYSQGQYVVYLNGEFVGGFNG